MNKIYNIINEKTNGKYSGVRFANVRFENNKATVTVVCSKDDYGKYLQLQSELSALVNGECGFNCPIKTVLVQSDANEEELIKCVSEFIKQFPYLSAVADNITASQGVVRLKIHKGMYTLAQNDTIPRLKEYLLNRFIEPVKLEIEQVEYSETREENENLRPQKTYKINALTPIIGNVNVTEAISAASVDGNNDDIAVCGILTMPTAFMSKSDGVKASRPYEKCVLYDGEHTLQCRFFPRGDDTLLNPELINTPVCVVGNTELVRGRTGELSMLIKSLAKCDADGLAPIAAPPAKAYKKIKPQPYEEYVQASLFQTENKLPNSLKGSFVVFDFETTGLSIFYDKPTEIGAVKIVDGVITETFTTLMDPQRPIPPEVSEKTGITDDMVKGKPKVDDVLRDFYKFSEGSALIGHNISFDFPFLLKFGNRGGYTFGTHKTFDTMGMAPKAIPGIESVSLDSVLGKLGLVNDNAHRALSDALMTAKAFIAMTKMLENV